GMDSIPEATIRRGDRSVPGDTGAGSKFLPRVLGARVGLRGEVHVRQGHLGVRKVAGTLARNAARGWGAWTLPCPTRQESGVATAAQGIEGAVATKVHFPM